MANYILGFPFSLFQSLFRFYKFSPSQFHHLPGIVLSGHTDDILIFNVPNVR